MERIRRWLGCYCRGCQCAVASTGPGVAALKDNLAAIRLCIHMHIPYVEVRAMSAARCGWTIRGCNPSFFVFYNNSVLEHVGFGSLTPVSVLRTERCGARCSARCGTRCAESTRLRYVLCVGGGAS